MALINVSGGLELKVPAPYTTNYHNDFVQHFAQPIATHDHSGGGKGEQLTSGAFADNAISGEKILLANGQALRSLNQAGTDEVDLLYLDDSDYPVMSGLTAKSWTPTITPVSGSLTSVVVSQSSHVVLGKLNFLSLNFSATAASLGNYISVTLPVAGAHEQRGHAYVFRQGTDNKSGIYMIPAAALGSVRVYLNDLANYPDGSVGIFLSAFYITA